MPIIDMLSRFKIFVKRPNNPFVPYFMISGKITSDTTYEVGELLNRVSNKSNKLAVVINSRGGDPSQACIISDKLKNKAKQLNVELVTFAQQYALNSAFYILTQGNRVFVDKTTYIGGVQVGAKKLSLGSFSEYYKTITYSQEESYAVEMKKDGPFAPNKAAEMKQLFQQFSTTLKEEILKGRNKIQNASQIDLTKLYCGQEALKLGLVDGIGRVHQTIPKLVEGGRLELLRQSELKKFVTGFKRMQFNS